MPSVGILIVDDDRSSQTALRELLDSEGWRVGIVPLASQALPELAGGDWSLVVANVSLTGLEGPLFSTLKELAQAAPLEDGHKRARVLFLVPELAGALAQPILEREHLPYALKPFHLHDFLEKVSDLLVEVKAIAAPIRQVRYEFGGLRKKKKSEARSNSMFASRDSFSYTDEELAEYEKQESESSRNRRPKRLTDLGNPRG